MGPSLATRASAAQIQEICERLAVRSEVGAKLFDQVLPPLAGLFGAGHAMAYEVAPQDGALSIGFVHSVGFDGTAFKADLDPLVRRMPVGWGHYNAVRPEPAQRNRALEQVPAILARLRHVVPELGRCIRRDPWLAEERQLRILSCEGPSLLAWFGVCRREPFSAKERRVMQRFARPLQERLTVERQLGFAPIATQALDLALEAVGAPAFILRGSGEVIHANAAGRVLLDGAWREVREALRSALLGAADRFIVTRLASPGFARYALAVATGTRRDPAPRAAALAARWSLTGPQRRVLARVAGGAANKRIAGELGCAESTVELHVTALLRRAEATSRSELVAKFWSEEVEVAS